jgi:hypothetical protein
VKIQKAVWSTAFVNDLPDAAFAAIETGGKREDGKTTPRSLRHLPHHNASVKSGSENSSVDLPHLRNALARVEQMEAGTPALRARAKRHLQKHATTLLKKSMEGLPRVRGTGVVGKSFSDEPVVAYPYDMILEVGGKGGFDFQEGDTGIGVIQTHEIGLEEEQAKLTSSFGWDTFEPKEEEIGILSDLLGYDAHHLFEYEIMVSSDTNEGVREELEQAGFWWDSSRDRWKGQFNRLPVGYRANGHYTNCWISRCDLEPYFEDGVWEDLTDAERTVVAKYCPVKIHTDIRLAPVGAAYWEGGECWTQYSQFDPNGLRQMAEGEGAGGWVAMNLQAPKGDEVQPAGAEIIRGDLAWMVIGKDGPQLLEPGAVGSPSDWARITERETFRWRAGQQTETSKEFWFDGSVMRGRWVIELYPRLRWVIELYPRLPGAGWKMWGIRKTESQTMSSNEEEPVQKANEAERDWQHEIKILKIAEPTKRLVTGLILEPETPDAQGDIYSEDEVEEAAFDYMSNYRDGSTLGEMHKKTIKNIRDIETVESWIQRESAVIAGTPIKKGSWMMTVRVNQDDAWEKVKKGEYNGFSIGGKAKAEPLT